MCGIYAADIFCDDCIEAIKDRIASEMFNGDDNSGMMDIITDAVLAACSVGAALLEVADYRDILDDLDEWDYDSDSYPKYASGDSESDCPEHCGGCGVFMENELTSEGNDYVVEAVNEDLMAGRTDSVALEVWKPFYDYLDFHAECEQCGRIAELDCGSYGICIICEEGDDCDD